jgi:ABC-type Mn2+/Zn2+ transport system ATPase subunit
LKYIANRTLGEGTVVLPATKRRPSRSAAVAYIPQDPSASTAATLTAEEHLALFQSERRLSLVPWWRSMKRTPEVITPFLTRPAQYLSGGQRQLLSCVSLVLRPDKPEVVLLDEPLTYLDPDNALACVSIVSDLRSDRRCIVVVQHDLDGTKPSQSGTAARDKLAQLVGRTEELPKLQKEDAGT